MRALIFAAVTAASIALGAPFAATAQQLQGPPPPAGLYNPALGPNDPAQNLPAERRVPDWTIEQRMQWTWRQVQQGQDSGSLSPAQVERARAKLDRIRSEEARLKGWHGLFTKSDQAYLFRRLDQVNQSLGLASPWSA